LFNQHWTMSIYSSNKNVSKQGPRVTKSVNKIDKTKTTRNNLIWKQKNPKLIEQLQHNANI